MWLGVSQTLSHASCGVNLLNQHLTKNTRGEAVFRHEIGHALDDASGGLSNSFWFIAAYELDFEKLIMNVSMKDEMVRHFYYLQEGQAGRRETFAELFAILIGGGSDRKAVLKVAFPNSYNAVQEWIGRLK
ncbi:MAG: hypothetical protein LAE24_10615 [Candidatus Contendobacter sp.]|nr:hypothetical protein [Candidatus Contendobacter sp.]